MPHAACHVKPHGRTLLTPPSPPRMQVHEAWLYRVPFLYHVDARSPLLIGEMVLGMTAAIYPPSDHAPPNRLYVVQKGFVVYGGANLSPGMVWGADCVLAADFLRSRNTARAVGFVEVFFVPRQPLLEMVGRYPATQRRLRRYVASLAFRRMFTLCGMAKTRPLMVAELCALYPHTLQQALNAIMMGLGDDGIVASTPTAAPEAVAAPLGRAPAAPGGQRLAKQHSCLAMAGLTPASGPAHPGAGAVPAHVSIDARLTAERSGVGGAPPVAPSAAAASAASAGALVDAADPRTDQQAAEVKLCDALSSAADCAPQGDAQHGAVEPECSRPPRRLRRSATSLPRADAQGVRARAARAGVEGGGGERRGRFESVLDAIAALQGEMRNAHMRHEQALATLTSELAQLRANGSTIHSKDAAPYGGSSPGYGAGSACPSAGGNSQGQAGTCVCVHVASACPQAASGTAAAPVTAAALDA